MQKIGLSVASCAARTFSLIDRVRLAKKLPPLTVPEHDVADEELPQHRRADLAGERARLVRVMFCAPSLSE